MPISTDPDSVPRTPDKMDVNTCPRAFTWTESCNGEEPQSIVEIEENRPFGDRLALVHGEVVLVRGDKSYNLLGIAR